MQLLVDEGKLKIAHDIHDHDVLHDQLVDHFDDEVEVLEEDDLMLQVLDDEIDEYDFIDIDEVVEVLDMLLDVNDYDTIDDEMVLVVDDDDMEIIVEVEVVDELQLDLILLQELDELEHVELLIFVISHDALELIQQLEVIVAILVVVIAYIDSLLIEHSVQYHNNKKTQSNLSLFQYVRYYKLNPSRIP